MNQKTPNLDTVFIVGGLIAGAYIFYKFSQGAKSVTDTVSQAIDSVKNGITNAVDSAKNALPQGAATVSKTVTTSDPNASIYGGGSGLNDPNSFLGVSTADPFDLTNPLYTSGRVYSYTDFNPMVSNKIDNPFSFI